MTRSRGPRISRTAHPPLGGTWTDRKLEVLARYLASYTTALKDQPSKTHPFRKAYIDAFAGTGYRDARQDESAEQPLLFPDLADAAPQELLEGSAKLALKTEPPFDKYVFIESSSARCTQLGELRAEFPHLAARIEVRHGEANAAVQDMCGPRKDWKAHRAVLFLDAFGMQVEWKTIEAVALTKAIDLWFLFPLGMGVNRLLTRSGDIPATWRHRLNVLLGNEAWYDELYPTDRTPNLFGADAERRVKATMATIGRYFNDRLKTLFAGVAEEPGVLRNSTNNPLYLLCFAVGNERGKGVAIRIANHLLKGLH